MQGLRHTTLPSEWRVKLELMQTGLAFEPSALAYLRERIGDRPLSLADYASTSGVSLLIGDDVWVNAPTAQFNPNFVFAPTYRLAAASGALELRDAQGRSWPVRLAPVPDYHRKRNAAGNPYTDYVHTHTDRARISPIRGCSMRCTFCDIPYEFKGRYWSKPVAELIEALDVAIHDPLQPAHHVLISGGTPAPRDRHYLRDVYRAVLHAFPDLDVDIMMVPHSDILNLEDLMSAGVRELSLNIEIFDRAVAARIMPEKFRHGLENYLDFIEQSVEKMGRGRVRSMLLVGLESEQSTLDGVRALAERGCMPVLSPFRPDPISGLADHPAPSADLLERVYSSAIEICSRAGVRLGPTCLPCMHNTLTFPCLDGADETHGQPFLV